MGPPWKDGGYGHALGIAMDSIGTESPDDGAPTAAAAALEREP
jgi:hypothetical protein